MSSQPPEPGEYVGKHIAPGSYGPSVTAADLGRAWQPRPQPQPQPAGAHTPQQPAAAYAPPQYGAPHAPPPPWEQQHQGFDRVVTPRNPVLSVLCSFFVPGLGTIVNGQTVKGILILFAHLLSVSVVGVLVVLTFWVFLLPLVFAVWVFGLVDAYRGAVRFNERHGVAPGW